MKLRPILGWRGLIVLLLAGRWRWVRRLGGGRWELWWCDKPIAAFRWFPTSETERGRPINACRRRALRTEVYMRGEAVHVGGRNLVIIPEKKEKTDAGRRSS